MKTCSIIAQSNIINKIYIIRGKKVMFDNDLAEMYDVDTGYLNRQVRRNIERFPKDFMFQLTKIEFKNLKCRFGTSKWGGKRKLPLVFTENGVAMLSSILRSKRAIQVNIQIMRVFIKMREYISLRSQFATLKTGRGQHSKYLPFAFTEHGIAMLSSVLNSKKAINVNIQIIRAFIKIRELLFTHKDLKIKIEKLERKYKNHDQKITLIFEAIRQLLDPPKPKKEYDIGFNVE